MTHQLFYLQVVATGFALFAISRAWLRAYRREITIIECVFWSVVWFGLIGIALLPNLTTTAAKLAGLGRGADLIIFTAIILLFYLSFRIYVKVETCQRDITKLVRELALQKKK